MSSCWAAGWTLLWQHDVDIYVAQIFFLNWLVPEEIHTSLTSEKY